MAWLIHKIVQTLQQLVQVVQQWLDERIVPPIHTFLKQERLTPGAVAVARSVGAFIGTVLAGWLVFNANVFSSVATLGALAVAGFLLVRAMQHQPAL